DVRVPVDLSAKKAACERVLGIAVERDRAFGAAAILDLDDDAASIRAVMRANRLGDASHRRSWSSTYRGMAAGLDEGNRIVKTGAESILGGLWREAAPLSSAGRAFPRDRGARDRRAAAVLGGPLMRCLA